jgi:hypothetical protein
MKRANNALNQVLKVRCALKSLTENQLLLGKCSIVEKESGNRRTVIEFGIVSNSEGVDVYLEKKKLQHQWFQVSNALGGMLLPHWVMRQLKNHHDKEILNMNLEGLSDFSNALKFLSRLDIWIEVVQWGNQGLLERCFCMDKSHTGYKCNQRAKAPSRTAGKHQGLSRRRLEEFYHG